MNDDESGGRITRDPFQLHERQIVNLLEARFGFENGLVEKCSNQTPLDAYIRTSSSWRMEIGRMPKFPDLSKYREDFLGIFRRGLGHLAANPSLEANKEALNLSYSFPTSVDRAELVALGLPDNTLIPNENPETARAFFVNMLGDQAVAASANYRNRILASDQVDASTEAVFRQDKFLMVGERGIGKTIFLNYLLAQYTGELHKKRVICVRLDLTKEVPENLGIERWLEWKICRILFTYYDKTKFDRDVAYDTKDPIFAHLIEKESNGLLFDLRSTNVVLFQHAKLFEPELTHAEFESSFRATAARLRSPSNGTPTELKDAWFFPMLWEYLLMNKNCSFIIILDGLDQLGLSKVDQKRYKRLVEMVNRYLSTEKSIQACTLVTMRPKTFRDRIGDDNFRPTSSSVYIAQDNTERIVNTRENFLVKGKFFLEQRHTIKHLGRNYPRSIKDFSSAYLQFATNSLTHSVSPNLLELSSAEHSRATGFDVLEQIFGENKRKTMQALTSAAYYFASVLPEEFERLIEETARTEEFFQSFNPQITLRMSSPYRDQNRYQYLFLEALMLESPNQSFRREKYVYRIEKKGKYSPRASTSVGVLHFLHNIFHHCHNPAIEDFSHIMVGMRILQYAKKKKVFEKKSLVGFLVKVFEYDKNAVKQKFDEMLEDGLLKHSSICSAIISDHFRISYSGRYVSDRLVHCIEYVCLSLQTCPLPTTLVEEGYFSVRPHSSREFVVYNKVMASINFCRFLRMVEEQEKKRHKCFFDFSEAYEEEAPEFKDFDASFAFVESVKKSLLASVVRIVAHAHEKGLATQLKNLDVLLSDNGCDLSFVRNSRRR